MLAIRKDQVKIYAAGKTWYAALFQELRDQHGFNIISRWIDHDQVLKHHKDEHPPEVHENRGELQNIWDLGCKPDCIDCDMMVLRCMPVDGNTLSGALVEIGNVTILGKPAYIIGECESTLPVGNSDRAWKSQSVVHELGNVDPIEGFNQAVSHYIKTYAEQWALRNMPAHYHFEQQAPRN